MSMYSKYCLLLPPLYCLLAMLIFPDSCVLTIAYLFTHGTVYHRLLSTDYCLLTTASQLLSPVYRLATV